MLTREQAVEIAKRQARAFHRAAHGVTPIDYTYLVNVESEDWMPHEWVIAAIIEAGDRDYPITEVAQAVKDLGIGFVARKG